MTTPTCPRCEQLCEELSQLQAKCAEMRAAISRALCVGLHEGHLISHEKKAEACRQQLEHALSSDCGKDYVPRSELDELRDHHRREKNQLIMELNAARETITEMAAKTGSVAEEWKRQADAAKAEVEKLREDLKDIMEISRGQDGRLVNVHEIAKEALAQKEEK